MRKNPCSAYNRALRSEVATGSYQAATAVLTYARSITRVLLAEWEAEVDTSGQWRWTPVEIPGHLPPAPRIVHPTPAKRGLTKPPRLPGVKLDTPEEMAEAQVSCKSLWQYAYLSLLLLCAGLHPTCGLHTQTRM